MWDYHKLEFYIIIILGNECINKLPNRVDMTLKE